MKQKGDKIVIRLAGKPISYFIHWIDKKPVICPKKADCELCQKVWPASQIDEAMREKRKQQFAWPVIDRADGQAKIFKAGFAIFSGIGEYAKNPKWGDAMLYDLEITRTELSPANFYSVVADPTSIGVKLTKEELEEVKKLEPLLDFTTTQDRKDEEVISAEDEAEIDKVFAS